MCDPSVKHAIWKGIRCWRCCLSSLIRVASATVVLNLRAMRVVEVVMSHVFPSSEVLSRKICECGLKDVRVLVTVVDLPRTLRRNRMEVALSFTFSVTGGIPAVISIVLREVYFGQWMIILAAWFCVVTWCSTAVFNCCNLQIILYLGKCRSNQNHRSTNVMTGCVILHIFYKHVTIKIWK